MNTEETNIEEAGLQPCVILLHGFSGSGKKTAAQILGLDALIFKSDEEFLEQAPVLLKQKLDAGDSVTLVTKALTYKTVEMLTKLLNEHPRKPAFLCLESRMLTKGSASKGEQRKEAIVQDDFIITYAPAKDQYGYWNYGKRKRNIV